MEAAETLGFMAAVYEWFSEPSGLRMVDRGVGVQVIIEKGGVWPGHPGDADLSRDLWTCWAACLYIF